MTTHKRLGVSDEEWVRRSIEEARTDPVGLWAIVQAGRDGFEMTAPRLEKFVGHFVRELVRAGGVPVIGDKNAKGGWRPLYDVGGDPQTIADAIVRDWTASGADPGVDGPWFVFPSALVKQ